MSFLLAAITYGSPVHYPIELAGNFAEPRPNHFHGGCDIKTGQVEGKALHSIGDGYVSKITIGLLGFGNALYIHHPEGYTSVYCHLQDFSPRIKAMLRKTQYGQHKSQGLYLFAPGELPISRDEFIAWSGNSGASQAPHLHLEVHHNKTWNMLDPLMFIGHAVNDHLAPQAHGFMATPIAGKGTFGGSQRVQVFGFSSHHLATHFTAWGKVGFGIWANDYMESTYNNYGIRKQQLFVDGRLAFQSDANNIPVSSNLQVNYWGDYQHYLHAHVWYMRSYLLPGITLPIFKTNRDRGVVNFLQERDYHLTYVLTDFAGNSSKYSFTVTGHRTTIPSADTQQGVPMCWDKTNIYMRPNIKMTLHRGLLAEHVTLDTKSRSGQWSSIYSFHKGSYPLLGYGMLSLKVHQKPTRPSQLYIVSHWGTDRYMGGTYHNGWVTGHIRELGATYEVACDNHAPMITPIGIGEWSRSGQLTIGLKDEQSGLAGYQAFVDGQFVLFQEVPKSPWVRCRLSDTPIYPTRKTHTLKFVAWDKCQNQRIFETHFIY